MSKIMPKNVRYDSIAILLANRKYLYHLLQKIFGDEPTLETLNSLNSDFTQTSLALLSMEDKLSGIKSFLSKLEQDREKELDKLCSEYTRLFLGPTKLPAPPWESVYVNKERLIFQESTLKVREWYLKYDFVPTNYRTEADDHIALELDFMANLADFAENSLENNQIDSLIKILNDQKSFLEKHMLNWVPQYVADLQASTTHPFYFEAAGILNLFLKVDHAVVTEIIRELNI